MAGRAINGGLAQLSYKATIFSRLDANINEREGEKKRLLGVWALAGKPRDDRA